MDFEIPADIQDTLDQLDAFIDAEIKPLEQQDDNIRFFDHRDLAPRLMIGSHQWLLLRVTCSTG
jgi:hypothetical protein